MSNSGLPEGVAYYSENLAEELRKDLRLAAGAPTYEIYVLDEMGRPILMVPVGTPVKDISNEPSGTTPIGPNAMSLKNVDGACWAVTEGSRRCYTRSNGRKYCCGQ